MNELERFEGPISTGQSVPRLISRRLYNVVLTGIVLLSFVVMAASSHITATADFQIFVGNNALTYSVATIVASIVGIVLMNVARAKENLPIAVVGYALFALSFGFAVSFVLTAYSLESLSLAFTATAGIVVVFGVAGFLFPQFFAKIQGVLFTGLLTVVVIEIVLMLMGVRQSITDVAVILLFCGFIGYDVYRSQTIEPTVTNALWSAVDLYLDIINVFLRLLAIFGNRE